MKAVISNRIYLTYEEELLEKLKSNLTYSFQPSNPEAMPEVICNATTIGKRIITIPSGRIDLIPKGWEIINKRVSPKFKFPPIAANIKLRPDQQAIYDEVGGDCIINAQPGWGKTFTGLAIASKFGLKTLIVTQNVALRQQWEDEYTKMFGLKAGVIGSGIKEINKPVVIANVQTLNKLAQEVAGNFGLIIMDEVHMSGDFTDKKLANKSNRLSNLHKVYWRDAIWVGFSATPMTEKWTKLGGWSSMLYMYQTKQLIEEGFLCNYIYKGTNTQLLKEKDKVKTYSY